MSALRHLPSLVSSPDYLRLHHFRPEGIFRILNDPTGQKRVPQVPGLVSCEHAERMACNREGLKRE
jgi:hypothetical protein